MYKSIKLLAERRVTEDSDGFPTYEDIYITGIAADFTDTKRADEMLANQMGYTVDQVIEIMACNYNSQSEVIDESDGTVYEVKRTHRKNKSSKIELTCQRRAI